MPRKRLAPPSAASPEPSAPVRWHRRSLTRGGARVATAALLVLAALVLGLLALIPGVGYLEAVVLPALALRLRRTGSRRYAGLRILARVVAQKLVLIVIDGLTPAMLERAVEQGTAPALALLAENGSHRRAVTTFPSLTPVCLSSLATGAHPDVHRIPHLVWYHEREQRLVEYGSSFRALRAAGTAQSIRDAVFNLNAEHLSPKRSPCSRHSMTPGR